MKRHKHIHIYQLMFVPIILIALLYISVYGGVLWVLIKVVKNIMRQRTETNDSVID